MHVLCSLFSCCTQQYLSLLDDIASMGDQERDLLVQRGAVAALADFFMQARSPLRSLALTAATNAAAAAATAAIAAVAPAADAQLPPSTALTVAAANTAAAAAVATADAATAMPKMGTIGRGKNSIAPRFGPLVQCISKLVLHTEETAAGVYSMLYSAL
jgi:hypothetical protein